MPLKAICSMRVVLYALFLLLFTLATLEVGARLLVANHVQDSRYLAMSQGLPGLSKLLEDRLRTGSKYYDYYLYSPEPVSSASVTITNYYSARRTPASAPREKADTVVWTFGGSTMMNLETTDEFSIANTIAKVLAEHGLKPHVENFGVGSFQSSLELVKFSRLLAIVPETERPKIVIFYDGFNDAVHGYLFGAGAIQSDLSAKLAALVDQRSKTLVTYGLSTWLTSHSRFWRAYIDSRVQLALFPVSPADNSETNLNTAVSIYVNNIDIDDAICRAFDIQCFFALQPLLATKQPLTPNEREILSTIPYAGFVRRFYQSVPQRMGNRPNFINASHVLDA